MTNLKLKKNVSRMKIDDQHDDTAGNNVEEKTRSFQSMIGMRKIVFFCFLIDRNYALNRVISIESIRCLIKRGKI